MVPEVEIHVGPGRIASIGEALRAHPDGGTIILHGESFVESIIVSGSYSMKPHGDLRPVLTGTEASTIELYGGQLQLEGIDVRAPRLPRTPGHAVHLVTAGRLMAERCSFSSPSAAAVAAGGNQSHLSMRQCSVQATTKAAIFVYRFARAELDYLEISEAGLAGIEVTSMANVRIERSVVRNCRQDGAVVNGNGTVLKARACKFLGNAYAGLAVMDEGLLHAVDCEIADNGQVGVLASGQGRAFLVSGNEIRGHWRGPWLTVAGGEVRRGEPDVRS
ncbi:MAG: right-handed parallel beta-helix repeat-containing protein [Candidatus Sericytochromatia bacterium]|nr:right-handed parallel beta-helix repeat-containing protein [Candidatus Sericytochromatia bacterium]